MSLTCEPSSEPIHISAEHLDVVMIDEGEILEALQPQPRVQGLRVLLSPGMIDYKTSMITDEDPLRGLLFY